MKESSIQSLIMMALSQANCIVWRVDTAGAWVGQIAYRERDIITLKNAKMIHAGLCKGGSDIIGIHKPTGKFIAIEVKNKNGRITEEQQRFINAIKAANGIAGIARSVEDALQLLPRG